MHNRRQFLGYAIGLALLPSLRALALQDAASAASSKLTVAEFTADELAALAAAMDEIIPAGNGMPPASAVGGVQYLQFLGWQYPEIRNDIRDALKTLAQISASHFQGNFANLSSDRRIQVLRAMEKGKASAFATLIGYVYEAYYTNPRIVGLISCLPSPVGAEEVETLLAPVRKLTHLYRQVL